MGDHGAEKEVVGRDDATLWKAGGNWRARVREIRRGGEEVCLGFDALFIVFGQSLLRLP